MSAPDIAKLEEENARLGAALSDSYSVLAKTKTALEQLQAQYDALKYELDWFKRQLFGSKSESASTSTTRRSSTCSPGSGWTSRPRATMCRPTR